MNRLMNNQIIKPCLILLNVKFFNYFSYPDECLSTVFLKHSAIYSAFQLQITASVLERPLRATWALLLLPEWLAAAVRKPKLLFVTERGLHVHDSLDWSWWKSVFGIVHKRKDLRPQKIFFDCIFEWEVLNFPAPLFSHPPTRFIVPSKIMNPKCFITLHSRKY